MREKCPNTGKYGTEKTPYLDTFVRNVLYPNFILYFFHLLLLLTTVFSISIISTSLYMELLTISL